MRQLIEQVRRAMCEDFGLCVEAGKEHVPGAPDAVQRYYERCRKEQSDRGKEYCARVAWQIYCTHKSPDDPSCTKYGKTRASLPLSSELLPEAAVRLKPADRTKVNNALDRAGLGGDKRFRRLGEALSTIGTIFQQFGLEMDDVLSADLFSGDEGRRTFGVAFSNESDAFSPVPIGNSQLVVSWFQGQTGYEVVAYLS